MPPTTPRRNRARETYGDVGRMVEPLSARLPSDRSTPEAEQVRREAARAAHKAIGAEEPTRRYATVRDNEGHVWERGNTRWTCTSPINGRDVTQIGRLPWSNLVSMYGPLTVLDEYLPDAKAPKCEPPDNMPAALREEHTQSIPDSDSWVGGTHTTCLRCGARVKFRVRETDRPPWARILPHRTDGTPTR